MDEVRVIAARINRDLLVACGEPSPAHSAGCRHERLSTSDNEPSKDERGRRRGSNSPDRPPIAADPVVRAPGRSRTRIVAAGGRIIGQ
jgi:hypothetical protein